jgi:hypothetical protein
MTMARRRRRGRRRQRDNPGVGTLLLLGGGAVAVYFLVIKPRVDAQQAAYAASAYGMPKKSLLSSVLEAGTAYFAGSQAQKQTQSGIASATSALSAARYKLVRSGSTNRCLDQHTGRIVDDAYCGSQILQGWG